MSNFGKGIPLASGFDLGAKLPLDSRLMVETYTDLDEHVKNNRVFPGLTVYVKDRDENYQYNGTDWVLFGRGSVSTTIVDTYEDIANLKNVGLGSLIYVKSDVNKNGEENMYVVTEDQMVDGSVMPKKYVALSTFAKSLVPTLQYDASLPANKKIYLGRDEEFILKFMFTSDSYGDGKYKVYRNGGLIRSFSASKGSVIMNLGKFEVNGTYSLEVSATDYFGVPAPTNLKYEVIVGGLELTSSFDETLTTAIYEIGDTIAVPYTATVSDRAQKVKVKFSVIQPSGAVVEEVIDTNTYEASSTWNNSSFFSTRGLYKLEIQAYTGTGLEDTTEGTFISNKLSYSFRVLAEKEIGIVSELVGPIDTNTYVSIPFKLMRKNTSMLTMRGSLFQKQNGNWVEYTKTDDVGINATCNVTFYWSVGRLPQGEYKYELWGYSTDFTEKSIDPAIMEFPVTQSSYKRVDPVTTNLIAWFDANDRRNTDSDKNIWYNHDGYNLGDRYRIELHDLNYDDNGWKNIDGLADNVNGEFVLKMNGQSWGQMVKVEVNGTTTPYSPFSVFENSGQTGITIETAIKTRCNGDLKAKVLTCMEGTTTTTPGVSIDYDKFYLSSLRQPMSMDFMEDEWVHVAFVVDREVRNLYGEGGVGQENIEDLNQVRTMRIYINGVLCGCNTFAQSDKFLDAADSSYPLMLNACMVDGKPDNFADSEFKFIRVYNKPLKSSEVVTNYISHIYDQQKQQAMKDRNDPAIVALPKIVFERNVANNAATINPNAIEFSQLHSITDKAKSKKEFVDCTMYIHNLDGYIETIDNVEVYLQGTSSLQYPVKNYQIKKYNLPIGNTERKKEKFVPKIKEGSWVEDSVYTLKVDYMEQSHMHNTPTAVFYDQILDALGAASPARKDGYRDSIDGFPCIVYYNNDPGGTDSKEVLVGSFMFNIDKEGMELGFECEVTDEVGNPLPNKCISYEGTANTSDTAGCFFALDDNTEKVYRYYLEGCYPEYLKSKNLTVNDMPFDTFYTKIQLGEIKDYPDLPTYSADYTELDYVMSDFEARYSYCEDDEEATYQPMIDLVNWVSSCWEKQSDGEFILNREKFENEFSQHFDLNYMLAYYLQMQVFAQVDNCGKNCMWDTWDEKIFYPRPYDMDTSMGLSNTGTEIIRVDAEIIPSLSPTKATGHVWAAISNSSNVTDDRYLMYNTKTSRLWNAFADVFRDDIASTYSRLRNRNIYSVENITKTVYALTQDVIGEIYYNKDAASKYLQLTTETSSEFLQMLHGNREQKYKKFLTQRLIFLDTMYDYIWSENEQNNTLNSETRMRSDAAYDINTGKTESIQCHLGIAVYSPQYVTVSVGSGADAKVTAYVSPDSRYIDPDTGVEKDGTLFSFPVGGTNKEIGIFGSGNIKRIDRLETLDLTSISAERLSKILALNLSGSTRLSVLGLGQNVYLRELDCSRAMNLGTADEGKTLDISNCKNLQHMDVSVTKISGVNFPRNTNLLTCDLSYTNVTSVSINGAEFLTDIRITGCTEISDFSLNRCNKLVELNIANSSVRKCVATSCTALKTLNVSYCTQMQSFDVSGSDELEELIMTGNNGPVMNDLQLYSLYNLKRLWANESSTLNTIRFPKHESIEEAAKGDNGKPWEKLELLDISQSTIKKIQYGSADVANEVCDMSRMKNLATFVCNSATAVTAIENLALDTGDAGVANLFSGCFELRRISGSITTRGYSAHCLFYRCHKLNDIDDLTFNFRDAEGNPCITVASQAFFRCASATSSMLKKLLDACGSSLVNIDEFIYMWGVDVNVTKNDVVIGTAADRPNRDIPSDLFANTPNIRTMTLAFFLTRYQTIPGTLFDPIKNSIEGLSQTFMALEELTTVGNGLLKNKPKLKDCSGTFSKCYALKNYIDSDPKIFVGSPNITTTNQMFFNCGELIVGSNGVNGMFDPLENITTVSFMFGNCTKLNMSIPNGLLSKMKSLQRLDGLFYGCSKITSIPDTLFKTSLTDTASLNSLQYARNVFGGCSGIKGTVNRNFFAGAPNLVDIGNGCSTAEFYGPGDNIVANLGFFGNTNLEGYHEDILSLIPKVTNVQRLFYHGSANGSLKYCYHGNNEMYVNGISPNIFKNNKVLQNTAGMFTNNTSLIGHIPSNLFDSCKSTITNVSYMFQSCTGLNGTDNDEIDASGMQNVGISNKWFLNAKSLVNASGFLSGCTGFISSTIPEDLFKGCTSLQNAHEFFRDCQGLTCEIPRGLFDDCRGTLRTVNNMFYNCRNLTGEIPTGTYTTENGVIGYEVVAKGTAGALQVVVSPTDFNTQVSYEQVMTTAPDLYGKVVDNGSSYVKPVQGTVTKTKLHGLFSNCTQLENASGAFYFCEHLEGPIPFDLFYTDSSSERFLKLTNISGLFKQAGLNGTYTDVTGTKYVCNEDFLGKCPALTNVNGLFYRMERLPACNIFPNMFRAQSQITDASYLFFLTYNITGAITQNFLSTCLGKLMYVDHMFCNCNLTGVNQGFLNLGNKNTILRRVGCLFHGNDGITGTAPEVWNTNIFPNIENSENGYHHAFNACTKLTNYNTVAALAEGNWVSGKSH